MPVIDKDKFASSLDIPDGAGINSTKGSYWVQYFSKNLCQRRGDGDKLTDLFGGISIPISFEVRSQ